MSHIKENLLRLQGLIKKAEKASLRPSGAVTLVAVSKTQSDNDIMQALDAGQRVFGENRVQEAVAHWTVHRQAYKDLQLHLIGPLQTNKVKEAVALFDMIETVDRPALADALAAEMKKQGRNLPCLIQVNTGEEPQKAGIAPQDLGAFLAYCRDTCGLTITGLMCIPPEADPPALHFALLATLARKHQLRELSMGMSQDFQKAIPLGATFVRVGTALFGARVQAL